MRRILILAVAVAGLTGCAEPYQRPHFYSVDFIRDAAGHDRGEAIHKIADARCSQAVCIDASNYALQGAMMFGLAAGQDNAAKYFDGHYPGCMKAFGFDVFTDRAAARAEADKLRERTG